MAAAASHETDVVWAVLQEELAGERPLTQAVRLSKNSGERVFTDASAQASDTVRAPSREALLPCARGDQAALHRLYKETAPQLFGLALSILRSRDLAEDIVQDLFILVWRQAHSFDPSRGAAMAWLARIVRNRCFDVLRRRGREAPLDDESCRLGKTRRRARPI